MQYNIEVELHWSPPIHQNGLVTSYTVFLADSPDGSWVQHVDVSGDTNFLKIDNAQYGHKYYFRVSFLSVPGYRKLPTVITDAETWAANNNALQPIKSNYKTVEILISLFTVTDVK